jgi:hypothetical protein
MKPDDYCWPIWRFSGLPARKKELAIFLAVPVHIIRSYLPPWTKLTIKMTKHYELIYSIPGNFYQLKIFAALRFISLCRQICVNTVDPTQLSEEV